MHCENTFIDTFHVFSFVDSCQQFVDVQEDARNPELCDNWPQDTDSCLSTPKGPTSDVFSITLMSVWLKKEATAASSLT